MKSNFLSKKNSNPGFTMIELIIYIALIGMVMTSFVSFALFVGNIRNKTYSAQEVQANARAALDIVVQKIREAEDVIIPSEGISNQNLTLDEPGVGPNTTISVSGGVLQMTEGAGSPVPLTSSEIFVDSINFENLAKSGKRDNIRITATFTFNNASDQNFSFTKTYQTSATIRK